MGVKSDIEIAQEAQMLDIREVAAKVGVAEDDLELYGKYKAKISDDLYSKLEDKNGRTQSSFYRRFSCNNICK